MTANVIYVTQYGYLWKLPIEVWKRMVGQLAARFPDGYDLPEKYLLKRRPSFIQPEIDRPGRFFSASPDYRLVAPLDWTQWEWENELTRLSS